MKTVVTDGEEYTQKNETSKNEDQEVIQAKIKEFGLEWLETSGADYTLSLRHGELFIHWKGGTWEGGTWEDGTWEDGTWEDGTWKGGYWEDGYWKGGTWEGGTWKGGYWKGGLLRSVTPPKND